MRLSASSENGFCFFFPHPHPAFFFFARQGGLDSEKRTEEHENPAHTQKGNFTWDNAKGNNSSWAFKVDWREVKEGLISRISAWMLSPHKVALLVCKNGHYISIEFCITSFLMWSWVLIPWAGLKSQSSLPFRDLTSILTVNTMSLILCTFWT